MFEVAKFIHNFKQYYLENNYDGVDDCMIFNDYIDEFISNSSFDDYKQIVELYGITDDIKEFQEANHNLEIIKKEIAYLLSGSLYNKAIKVTI